MKGQRSSSYQIVDYKAINKLKTKDFLLVLAKFKYKQKLYVIYYLRFHLDTLVKSFAKNALSLTVYNYQSIKNGQYY